jgi:8-oxo-(d)GTP phosphatase
MANTLPPAATPPDVVAAGAVVTRKGPEGREVLLVHRPKYDDWSFPKGKLDRGERAAAAAVREVHEETGLRVRLGPSLGHQRYRVSVGMKTVHYWTGRPVGSADISGYEPNVEIDEVRWVDVEDAPALLSYVHDVATLDEALSWPRKMRTFVVLRHGVSRARKTWRRDDRTRPLLVAGRRQAELLVPVLAAYDVRRLVSSSSTRCVQTLEPYADARGWKLEREDGFSEEDASPRGVRRLVGDLVGDLSDAPASGGGLIVCSHRPVLPWIFQALGVEDARLEKGEMMVMHLRKGQVRAFERHLGG